jgi:hypothetical protein
MSGRLTAHAVYRWDGTVAVAFPFDRDVVDELKHQIPAPYRAWDPESREWLISLGWAQVAIEILRSAFGHVELEQFTSRRADPEPIRTSDPTYAELHLLPSAPWPVVEAVYRAMARMNHPDKGGDCEQMKRVNLAYESLQRRAGAA